MELIGGPILAVILAFSVIGLRVRWENRHGVGEESSKRTAPGGWFGGED